MNEPTTTATMSEMSCSSAPPPKKSDTHILSSYPRLMQVTLQKHKMSYPRLSFELHSSIILKFKPYIVNIQQLNCIMGTCGF